MSKNTIFFYGLFMDPDVLIVAGVDPSTPIIAELRDYRLELAERATLIPERNTSVWGTIMKLETAELTKLYSRPSVSDYMPVAVECHLTSGEKIEADVYILPEDYPLSAPGNTRYANQLIGICDKLGLPESHKLSILKIMKSIREEQYST